MMDKYFVAYESYDAQILGSLCGNGDVKGIILGDALCNKRMIRGGISELVLMMNRVLSSEKTAIYQAPLYVTSRNRDEVASILGMMDGYKKESFVIVQDFGTAELISREFKNLRTVWGQLGRVRELRFSDEFLKFLCKRNFCGMETGDGALAKRLAGFGLVPFFSDAVIGYQTVGRVCYLEYETGRCDPLLCRKGCYSLREENGEYEMTVDGFMLGKKYRRAQPYDTEELCDIPSAELIRRIQE